EKDIDVLQRHPLIGAKILEPIHFLQEVRQIIEQHHERYDGLGYPNSLAGEDILIEARILAVADTYDAMTSDRPYRKALPPAVAINEIREFSGTQFDPKVAELFLEMIERGNLFD
ncbi:MAG: HD domain-containing phosphohydrolase, partial [Desulfuromonadaceae bacterium]